MQSKNLPETYKGYSTEDLLEIYHQIPHNRMDSPEPPRDKVIAMSSLLREYKLAPVHQYEPPK